MSISLAQIQGLLNTYHRQQVQSRLSGEKNRHLGLGRKLENHGGVRVLISTEAKRIQVYQKMAEEVLDRFMRASAKRSSGGEAGGGPAEPGEPA